MDEVSISCPSFRATYPEKHFSKAVFSAMRYFSASISNQNFCQTLKNGPCWVFFKLVSWWAAVVAQWSCGGYPIRRSGFELHQVFMPLTVNSNLRQMLKNCVRVRLVLGCHGFFLTSRSWVQFQQPPKLFRTTY